MKRFAIVFLLFAAAVAAAVFASPASRRRTRSRWSASSRRSRSRGKDAKTATATLKDNKTDELVTVIVNDDLTLDKFKDHRIVDGRRDPAEVRGQGREERQQIFPQDRGLLTAGRPGESRATRHEGEGSVKRVSIVLFLLLVAGSAAQAKEHPGKAYIEKNGYQGPSTCEWGCHPGTAKKFLSTVHWKHASRWTTWRTWIRGKSTG